MSTRAQRARDIFLDAVEIAVPGQRAAYLDAACAGDPELRRRVEALLAAHERPEGLLDRAAIVARPAIAHPDGDAAPHAGRPGAVIGPYRLLEQIGEGGMGVVYLAEQAEPLRRRVALKVIKPGMDSAQVLARFEAERRALAMMDHPNIARVLDAGTTPLGRPYFVMERVDGVPITRYCDEARLAPRQRLELFIAVCQAIQHAHQKGVIHRDIKPSNILVAPVDGRPVPKVIDFGVAKAIDQPLTERTLFTRFGAIVGTPEYMSPEQAGSSPDVDTRSDVYALGVLLYELLTGTTPLDREASRQSALDEVLRRIREEEPTRPSTRLSGTGERLPSVAAVRSTEPARLARLVRGDLDRVVMKALEKDRARRYETADGLARDVQRYLDGSPVEAGPPSAWYRFGKFARRNRLALTAAAFAALALLAGTAVSTWQAVLARRARAESLAQRDEARRQEERARRAVDDMYTRVSQRWLAGDPGDNELRVEFLGKAAAYYEEFARAAGAGPGVRMERAHAWLRVGIIDWQLRRVAEAEAAYRRADELFAGLDGERGADRLECRDGRAHAAIRLGDLLFVAGRRGEAESFYRRAIALGRSAVSEHPGHLAGWINLANALHSAGDLLADPAMHREAEATYRKIVSDLTEGRADAGPLVGLLLRHHPVIQLINEGSVVGAIESGGDPRRVMLAEMLIYQAMTLNALERNPQAADCLQRALALTTETGGRASHRSHRKRAWILKWLADVLYASGRYREAAQSCREALELVPNEPKVHEKLAEILANCPDPGLRDPAEAVRLAARGVKLSPEDRHIRRALGMAYYRAGDWSAAAEAIRKSMELGGGGDAIDWLFLAMARWRQGDREEGRRWYDKAVAWIEGHPSAEWKLRDARREAEALIDPRPRRRP